MRVAKAVDAHLHSTGIIAPAAANPAGLLKLGCECGPSPRGALAGSTPSCGCLNLI